MSFRTLQSTPIMNVTNSECVLKSYCKSKGYEKPRYRIVSRDSKLIDGHVYRFKHYTCVVSVNAFELAESDGFSKRIARKKAAMLGLQQLRVCELTNFWQVYRTILPQAALQDAPSQTPILGMIPSKQLTITSGSTVEIEEMFPQSGILTPQSVLASARNVTSKVSDKNSEPNVPQTKTDVVDQNRERTSSDDSASLIKAAIDKLRQYDDDRDDEQRSRPKNDETAKPKFEDIDLRVLNENRNGADIREMISEGIREMQVIEETGHDDLNL